MGKNYLLNKSEWGSVRANHTVSFLPAAQAGRVASGYACFASLIDNDFPCVIFTRELLFCNNILFINTRKRRNLCKNSALILMPTKMTDRNFLEKVFNKSQAVLTTQTFDATMQKFLFVNARIKDIFEPSGPAKSAHTGIMLFRKMVVDQCKKEGRAIEDFIVSSAKNGEPFSKWNSRAQSTQLKPNT